MATRRQIRRLARKPWLTLADLDPDPEYDPDTLLERLRRLSATWQTEELLLMNVERIEYVMEYQLLARLPLARSWAASRLIEVGTHPEWGFNETEDMSPRARRNLILETCNHPEWGFRGIQRVSPRWVHHLIVENNLPVTPLCLLYRFVWGKHEEVTRLLMEYIPYLSPPAEDPEHYVTAWLAGQIVDAPLQPQNVHTQATREFLEALLLECMHKGYSLDTPDSSGFTAFERIDRDGSEALCAMFPPPCGLK